MRIVSRTSFWAVQSLTALTSGMVPGSSLVLPRLLVLLLVSLLLQIDVIFLFLGLGLRQLLHRWSWFLPILGNLLLVIDCLRVLSYFDWWAVLHRFVAFLQSSRTSHHLLSSPILVSSIRWSLHLEVSSKLLRLAFSKASERTSARRVIVTVICDLGRLRTIIGAWRYVFPGAVWASFFFLEPMELLFKLVILNSWRLTVHLLAVLNVRARVELLHTFILCGQVFLLL